MNIFRQVQIAQFHVDKKKASIVKFAQLQNPNNMQVAALFAEFCEGLSFIFDYFSFDSRNVDQFPRECLINLAIVKASKGWKFSGLYVVE